MVFECCVEIILKIVDVVMCVVIEEVIEGLDNGIYCVVEKIDGEWVMY